MNSTWKVREQYGEYLVNYNILTYMECLYELPERTLSSNSILLVENRDY
jgi:hypothetical protein